MIYKISLFLLIVVLSFSISIDYKAKIKNQKKLLEDYEEFLLFLSDYIKFNKSNVIYSIREFEYTYEPCWTNVSTISLYLEYCSLEDAWKNWLLNVIDYFDIDTNQANILIETSNYLGQFTSEIQINRIENNLRLVRQEIVRIENKLNINCKTIQKTIIFTGLTVGLIII